MKREKCFANESILAAANNVFDFEKFKNQQEDAIREFKEQQLSAKSENKNGEITGKKNKMKAQKNEKEANYFKATKRRNI